MSCDEMRLEKFEYVIKNVAQFFSGDFLPCTTTITFEKLQLLWKKLMINKKKPFCLIGNSNRTFGSYEMNFLRFQFKPF